jgi:hypothetical protein
VLVLRWSTAMLALGLALLVWSPSVPVSAGAVVFGLGTGTNSRHPLCAWTIDLSDPLPGPGRGHRIALEARHRAGRAGGELDFQPACAPAYVRPGSGLRAGAGHLLQTRVSPRPAADRMTARRMALSRWLKVVWWRGGLCATTEKTGH